MTKYTIDLTDEQVRRLIDYLDSTSGVVDKQIAAQLEEQVKPTEPFDFASVVRVKTGTAFVRVGAVFNRPWVSGEERRDWDELDVAEVLRVGVGEDPDSAAFNEGFDVACNEIVKDLTALCGDSGHSRERKAFALAIVAAENQKSAR